MNNRIPDLTKVGVLAIFLLFIVVSPVFGAEVSENASAFSDEQQVIPEIISIGVTPATADILIGGTQQFTAVACNSSGSELSGTAFVWESSDETIGTVDNSGLFTAVSLGTVTVSACNGNISANLIITVYEAEVPTVTPEPTPGSITAVMASITSFDSGVIPAVDDVYLNFANDNGARFNDFGNNTFRIKWGTGGLNALHITNDPRGSGGAFANYGQVTNTNNCSGTFYVSTTGGRGYDDDIFLCFAVNGTVPDDFRLHIQADGYQWSPNPVPHTGPAEADITYNASTLDEWFTKDDLIYGPQTWRPAASTQYPIFPNQDMDDTSNTFQIMFVDLYGGILTEHTLRVQYELQNMRTMAAFNVYGYAQNADSVNDYKTTWTNCLTGDQTGPSGWYVYGAPEQPPDKVNITPSSLELPLNGKKIFIARAYDEYGYEMSEASFEWTSSNTTVGTVDSNGKFSPKALGETEVLATYAGVSGTATVKVVSEVPIVLDKIILTPSELDLYSDDTGTYQFNAIGYDLFGDIYPVDVFTWSSSNKSVCSVNETGFMFINGIGNVTISAGKDTVTGTAEVTVRDRPDWTLDLIGTVNRMVSRTEFIDLAKTHPASYIDNKGNLWEGVNLSVLIGLVDDGDSATLNQTMVADLYRIFVNSSTAGEESSEFTSDELIGDETFVVGYKLNGEEIPDKFVDGRMYWPLRLHGSGCELHSNSLGQVSEIKFSIRPPVSKMNISEMIQLWDTDSEPYIIPIAAYDSSDAVISDTKYILNYVWTSSNEGVGIVDECGTFFVKGAGTTQITAKLGDKTATVSAIVYPSADDSHTFSVDGTGLTGFKTINDAIDFSGDGDVIVVKNGTYSESLVIDKQITLQSEYGRDNTTIGSGISIQSDNVQIKGFTVNSDVVVYGSENCVIDNNSIHGYSKMSGILLKEGSSNCTISGNEVKDTRSRGIDVENSPNNRIIGNTIEVAQYGIYVHGAASGQIIKDNVILSGGLWLAKSADKCLIENNSVFIDKKNWPALGISDSKNITIVNNTIVGEGAAKYGVGLWSSSDCKIYNNSISGGLSAAIYLDKVYQTSGISVYQNEIVGEPGKLFSSKYNIYLNSTAPVIYIYNNNTYTGFLGNHLSTYTGEDTNGDGIGDTSFTQNKVTDHHPLVSPIEDYLILEATSINVTPSIVTREVGETVNFSAEILDQRGEILSSAVPVWTSGDTSVGSVNATTGCFEALSPGDVTITATCGDCTGTADVTIVKMTKKTETTLFNLANCTFSDDGNGGYSVSVNASIATVGNNSIFMQGTGFNLTILTPSAPVTAGGRITGDVDEVILETTPITADLRSPGNVSASIRANLTGLPSGAGITTTITQTISNDTQSAFQIAATADGLNLDAVAYTMNIFKTNLTNGEDISDATIRMSVSPAWVAANGGYDAVKIIRFAEDGTKEVLETKYLGFDGELDQFEAFSPNGLSIFGLSATRVTPAPRPGFSSSSGGSGGASGSISTARCDGINAGEMGVFLLDKTAITEVDVKAGMNIPSMMLTAETVSAPSKIDAAPNEVYQYIEITSYLAPKDSMEMATLKFSVDTDWLDSLGAAASDVKIYRYDEGTASWAVLSTVADGKGDSCCNFFADTPSFSLFAITAEKGAAPKAPVDGSQPAAESKDTAPAGQPTQTGTQTPVKTNADNSMFVIIVVIAIIAACGGAYWWNKSGKK